MTSSWQFMMVAGSRFTDMPCEGKSDFILSQLGGWNRQCATPFSFHGSWPVGSGVAIFKSSVTSMYQTGVHAHTGMEVDRGWQISFLDPGEWRDNRITEADPELPEIGDVLTRDTLWGDTEGIIGAPAEGGDIEASFSVGTGVFDLKQRKERQSRLWEEFFADTSKWWDNRLDKKNPHRPDFRHKTRNKALWINNWFKPSWVEERLAALGEDMPPRNSALGAPDSRPQDETVLQRLCEEGQLTEAVHALHLLYQSTVPSVHAYSSLLQFCSTSKALSECKQVHAHIVKNGLELDTCLGEYLVHVFVKCGSLPDALEVFRKLPQRTAFSWTAIILGYIDLGQAREALRMYKHMQKEGVEPTKYTFVSLLRACGILADLKEGKKIHSQVVESRWESEMFVCASLVDMYSKCGSMTCAQRLFDRQSKHDVVSWSTMIAGYAQQGQAEKALQLYVEMEEESLVAPNERTFVSIIKACGNLGIVEKEVLQRGQLVNLRAFHMGKAIHWEAVRKGYHSNVYVAASLVNMYAKCGSVTDARYVFDTLSEQSVVTWNAMIGGYVQHEHGEKALQLYLQMQEHNVSPDDRTFVSVVKACGMVAEMEDIFVYGQAVELAALHRGKLIHAEAALRGYDSDVFVGNTLVDMYAKCGSILDASIVFDVLLQRDVVSWNALIEAFAQQEQGEQALQCYEQMKEAGVTPDDRTFVSVLKACTSMSTVEEEIIVSEQSVKIHSLEQGRQIHTEISRAGYLGNVFVGNSLIHMYANCGSTKDARDVFDRMPERSVVSWNSMISGYAQQEQGEKALQLYALMKESSVIPNEATFVCVLKACSGVGALRTCFEFHQDILHWGCEPSVSVARSLVHAYGKCGSMVDSHRVFNSLSQHDVVSWTAIIAGHARLGECDFSLKIFKEMQEAGMKPDGVTFVSVLAACSHAGWVEEGLTIFKCMSRDYGITATTAHFASLVDLLGRAGLLSKAERLIRVMPMQPTLPVWFAMLSACRKYINVELGRHAFEHAVRLAPKKGAAYVLMSNIYAHADMWDEANQTEEARGQASAWKKTGKSWIEHGDKVCTFLVGDRSHPQSREVYAKLKELSAQIEQRSRLESLCLLISTRS